MRQNLQHFFLGLNNLTQYDLFMLHPCFWLDLEKKV